MTISHVLARGRKSVFLRTPAQLSKSQSYLWVQVNIRCTQLLAQLPFKHQRLVQGRRFPECASLVSIRRSVLAPGGKSHSSLRLSVFVPGLLELVVPSAFPENITHGSDGNMHAEPGEDALGKSPLALAMGYSPVVRAWGGIYQGIPLCRMLATHCIWKLLAPHEEIWTHKCWPQRSEDNSQEQMEQGWSGYYQQHWMMEVPKEGRVVGQWSLMP